MKKSNFLAQMISVFEVMIGIFLISIFIIKGKDIDNSFLSFVFFILGAHLIFCGVFLFRLFEFARVQSIMNFVVIIMFSLITLSVFNASYPIVFLGIFVVIILSLLSSVFLFQNKTKLLMRESRE